MDLYMDRKAWPDYLKFIAMFLVVVYHTPPRYDTAHEVALFNMGAPVFFLLRAICSISLSRKVFLPSCVAVQAGF